MYRISIDVPSAEADDTVVQALRDLAAALPDAEVSEETGAAQDSYSLTVHVLPDPEED